MLVSDNQRDFFSSRVSSREAISSASSTLSGARLQKFGKNIFFANILKVLLSSLAKQAGQEVLDYSEPGRIDYNDPGRSWTG